MIKALVNLSVRMAVSGLFPIATARRLIEKKSTVSNEQNKDGTTASQLLIDISVFHLSDGGTGIQRVVRSILYELSLKNLNGIDVRYIGANRKKNIATSIT